MDPDVEALRQLVGDSVERRVEVAERIGVNEQTLYQIVRGIPLKSGKPRGVGRKLRDALDAAYPGWRSRPASASEPAAVYYVHRAPAAALLDAVRRLSPARWAAVRAVIDHWIAHPDQRQEAEAELEGLLSGEPAQTKRSGTSG